MYKYLLPLILIFIVSTGYCMQYDIKSMTMIYEGNLVKPYEITSQRSTSLNVLQTLNRRPQQDVPLGTFPVTRTVMENDFYGKRGDAKVRFWYPEALPLDNLTELAPGVSAYGSIFNTVVQQYPTAIQCQLPSRIESTTPLDVARPLTYRAKYVFDGLPDGYAIVSCIGYLTETNNNITLYTRDSTLNLTGDGTSTLAGETAITVIKVNGEARIEINNPNNDEVTVSFEKESVVTTKTLGNNEKNSVLPLYVNAPYKRPGQKTYSVNISATIT